MKGHRSDLQRPSFGRAIAALTLGALIGGALVSLTQFSAFHLGLGGGRYGGSIEGALVTAIFGAMIYALGLVAASPLWFLLDLRGCRKPWQAALLGATLSIAATVAYVVSINFDRGVPPLLDGSTDALFFLPIAVIGAVVGIVVWATAYRRPSRG